MHFDYEKIQYKLDVVLKKTTESKYFIIIDADGICQFQIGCKAL